MQDIFKTIIESPITKTIAIICISIFLYNVVASIFRRGYKKGKNKIDNRKRTYIKFFTNILKYAFIIVTLLLILQTNGINVSSMLAGVGIASAIVGLALQDIIKDIIMGADIVTDNYFSVGDVIKYKDTEGKVIGFGLRTTKLQDIKNGNIISITNRNITEAEILSNKLYMDIPVPYELTVAKMEEVSNTIAENIKSNDMIEDCRFLGLSDFMDSYIVCKLEIIYNPEFKYSVRRIANKAIKEELDRNEISVPYTQIDIHNK